MEILDDARQRLEARLDIIDRATHRLVEHQRREKPVAVGEVGEDDVALEFRIEHVLPARRCRLHLLGVIDEAHGRDLHHRPFAALKSRRRERIQRFAVHRQIGERHLLEQTLFCSDRLLPAGEVEDVELRRGLLRAKLRQRVGGIDRDDVDLDVIRLLEGVDHRLAMRLLVGAAVGIDHERFLLRDRRRTDGERSGRTQQRATVKHLPILR